LNRERSRYYDVAAVALPGVVAGGLVFDGLGSRSIWIDEAATITIASQHGAALGSALAHDGGNMLGYYALVHVLIGAFGDSTFLLRLPSAISAIVAVMLIALLARRMFGRAVAIVAGLFSAVSLPLVYWGQDARAYAPMVMFVTASYLALLVVIDAPAGRATKLGLIGYVLATTLALYMSFIAVLILPAQLLFVLGRKRQLGSIALAMGITVIAAVPLAVLARSRGAGQLFWVPKPSLAALVQVGESLTSSGFEPNFHPTATTGLLLVASVLGLVALAASTRRRGAAAPVGGPERARAQAIWCLIAWITVPVLLALAWSLVAQSVFTERNLLISLPPVGIALGELTVGGALARLIGITEPVLRPLGLGCALAVLALRALQLAPSYGVSPENWQAAVRDVLAQSQPGDCIAFYPEDGEMAFRYYIAATPGAAGRAPRSVLPTGEWSQLTPHVEEYVVPDAAAIHSVVASCDRLWFVTSHVGQLAGPPISRAHYASYLRLDSALSRVFLAAPSSSFGYADPVVVTLFER
jgi:mannosyltransferase